jgi:hypothetical protein
MIQAHPSAVRQLGSRPVVHPSRFLLTCIRCTGVTSAFARIALVMSMLVLCAGCGPRSDRLELSGAVTLDGAPLDGGSIQFSSLEGEKLIGTGAMISGGEYFVTQEKGLPPGTYRVEISAPDTSVPPVRLRTPSGELGIPTAPERIPAEYNVNSNQTIQVDDDSDNHFEFDIMSKPSR